MADERAKRIAEFIEPLRVAPGSKVTLAKDFDPAYKAEFFKKRDGAELLRAGVELLASTRLASRPRTPTASSSCSRRWMPPARTAPSATS